MHVGYFTMPLHPPGADPGRTMADDLEQLVFLDQLGFEEAWVGEHITAEWENIPCPDIFIAQALGMTRRMKLGTGVTCLPNHNPLMLAQRIAQLDQMAQGRFLWGVGSGGFPGDLELFELDAKAGEHRTVTRAALDLILDLWNDPKPGIYEAPRWRFRVPELQEDIALRLHFRPYQRPHPPIAVAGVNEKSDTLTLAGERGYIPMSINFVPPRILKTHWASVEAGARQAGRVADRATWRISRDVFIAETTAEARRQAISGVMARDWIGYFFPLIKKGRGLEVLKQDPSMPDSAITVEYLADNTWLVGDPDEVVRRIRALRQEVGDFGTLLVIGHEWEPREAWERSMRLLVHDVLPRVP
jgi:alkanesulfonate monooxygenase SsuD/methylene tetrahydromethanopterin reductase-like flavin-dependent oxidoreductase (luciferase family)